MIIRWYLDLALVKNVCIGEVHQLVTGLWRAYGMWQDWQDTLLGSKYLTRNEAKRAVEEWWGSRQVEETRMKKACAVHYSYRVGCVMCEAVNAERRLL